jgi:dihydropteroate synthase
MHMRGAPQTMQKDIQYDDVVRELYTFFENKLHEIDYDNVIIDPGIGFGKEVEHNLLILKNIKTFKSLGCPLLIGTSRKSFIGKILELPSPADRLSGTIASCVYAYLNGANILRVHDVQEVKRAIQLTEAIEYASDKKI